jgi:hypothetical protein
MIPDPKKTKNKKRKPISKKISDIAKTLERDFPGFKATHKKGTKSEFSMFKGGKSFSVSREAATPKVRKYATGKDIAKAINNKKKK